MRQRRRLSVVLCEPKTPAAQMVAETNERTRSRRGLAEGQLACVPIVRLAIWLLYTSARTGWRGRRGYCRRRRRLDLV